MSNINKKNLKISIVTPSFNQGRFIEQTIRSILEQNYSNLEYIVMDGGSTDNSVEIIEKYSNKIAYWQSKPDNGQADAITKGFGLASGDILGWINSDDYLLPGALEKIAHSFCENPQAVWLAGRCIRTDEKNNPVYVTVPEKQSTFSMMLWGASFSQPSVFWKKEKYEEIGGLNPSLCYSFDFDLFLRLNKLGAVLRIPDYISAFRFHDSSKTVTMPKQMIQEGRKVIRRHRDVSSLFFVFKELLRHKKPDRRLRNFFFYNKDKEVIRNKCSWLSINDSRKS
ncbi:MAG: glycosyltransferase family 2 protein [Planctomycetota bacterium]|jgi:glycosyltransferase involved in cell wall biosynthesis